MSSTPAARADLFVSVVAVLDRASDAVPAVLAADVQRELAARYENYEVILVDNGIAAPRFTELVASLDTIPCVRVLRLSRAFANDTAMFAGLEAAIGDYVVILEPGVDPVALIPELIARARDGQDIVQGVSTTSRNRGLFGLGRRAFYWYNRRYLGVDMPPTATRFTALSRRAVNSLTNVVRNHRYLRHLLRHVGYSPTEFPYEPIPGPRSRRTIGAGYREATEMITSYSTHPLRLVTIAGVIGAVANLAYAVYVVILNLLRAEVQEGWTTTSLQLSVMFFMVCIILAVQSEYIGRILTESRRDPSYFVMDEIESTTLLANEERRNVSV